MIDERLVKGVTTWLQDSDVPPPDARMSAGRAMAGVSRTPQLGRWFPPARLVRRARPAPVLAPRDLVPPSAPRTTKGVLSMFTATRIVVGMLVFALVGGGLLVGRALLPDGVEPVPAIASPSPSAEPTPQLETAPPDDKRVADSTFAAIRVIAELPEGSDPIELVPAPPHRPGAVFIDRATEAVMHVEDDGELRVLMQKDIDDPSRALEAAPATVDISGDQLVVIDAEGGLHQWADWRDLGRVRAVVEDRDAAPGLTTIDPSDLFDVTPVDDSEFDVHAIDATDGSLSRAQARSEPGAFGLALDEPAERISRDGGLAADMTSAGPLFVATSEGVERYVEGALDEDWSLEAPAGGEPDYRLVSATGEGEDGQLWLHDEAGRRFVAFDKADGSYLGSWAPEDYPLDDVRGLYVLGGPDGAAESVTWVTPTAVVRAALERPTALQPNVTPAPDPKGRLTTGDRPAGKRAFVWSGGGVELKADRLALRVAGHPVVRPPAVPSVTGDMQANEAQLEIEWTEGGIEQRIYVVLFADDTHWWIDWIWVYDGDKNGDWIEFENLHQLTRTPLGSPLVGDLRLESTSASKKKYEAPGTAVLRIDGLRLTALVPGTRPAPLADCVPFEDDRFEITRQYEWESRFDTWSTGYSQGILRGPGEPLRGMKAKGMTPAEVEAVLRDMGVCYRFRHEWQSRQELSDGTRRDQDFTDFRCSAPDTGTVIGLEPGAGHPAADGTAVLYVTVREQQLRDWPEPPPAGTDCPTQ